MIEKKKTMNNKKINAFQWILYGVILPIIISAALLFLYILLTGQEGKETMKKLPVIGTYFHHKEQIIDISLNYEQEIELLKNELQAEIQFTNELTSEMKKRESDVQQLLTQITQLEATIAKYEQEMRQQEEEHSIVNTYENMTPKKAAAILVEMNENQAIHILMGLNQDTLTSILERMPADKAATFTEKLASTN